MNFEQTDIPGLYLIQPCVFKDQRGCFIKSFHETTFAGKALETDFKEFFHSFSNRGVLRGMHFQLPPHDHAKLVFVTAGVVRDVILDLRKGSPAYGHFVVVELSSENARAVYIPRGCAHGFLSLLDNSCVNYLQTSEHYPGADSGILYNSFGMEWGYCDPVVSERDRSFVSLHEFESPFDWNGQS